MRYENRSIRQDQIEQAAYTVLDAKGYGGASMLAIAKAAKASNETLYNWYGDKTGLFAALVRRNAAEVKALLEAQIAAGGDAVETLLIVVVNEHCDDGQFVVAVAEGVQAEISRAQPT